MSQTIRGTVLVVMVYDVVSDRRRARLHGLLSKWGVQIQKSAFEARLTPPERRSLLAVVRRIVEPTEDRFVLYFVGEAAERHIEVIGTPRPRVASDAWIIV